MTDQHVDKIPYERSITGHSFCLGCGLNRNEMKHVHQNFEIVYYSPPNKRYRYKYKPFVCTLDCYNRLLETPPVLRKEVIRYKVKEGCILISYEPRCGACVDMKRGYGGYNQLAHHGGCVHPDW